MVLFLPDHHTPAPPLPHGTPPIRCTATLLGKDIAERVAAFWKRVSDNNSPEPDFITDSDFIVDVLRKNANPDEVINADSNLEDMIKHYAFISKEAGDLAKLKTQLKAEILLAIGSASKVLTSVGSLSCGTVKGSQGTLVTPDMIGTYIGAREGYRNVRFYPNKEK
jgi:hypothetical protein